MDSPVKRRLARLVEWLCSRDGVAYLALMSLALAVRVAIAPRLIVTDDMLAYTYWGQLFDQHPLTVYSVGGLNPQWTLVPIYPPVAIYLFGVVEQLYFGLGALLGMSLSHNALTSPTLKLVMKSPGILSDLALLTIMYLKAIRTLRRWRAWLAGATYALSPGILITVVVWGQSDSIVLLLVVLGLLMAARKQPIWCGVLLALAVSFKPQPIIFLPLALIALVRWGGARWALRGIAAFAATTLVIWLPYMLPPTYEIRALGHNLTIAAFNEFPDASHSGWNLWWLLGLEQRNAAAATLGTYSFTEVSGILFAVILLVVALGFWRAGNEGQLWAGAAILALAFFTIGTLQYERYLFPALGLFFLAAIYNRRYWLVYGVTTLTFMANYFWTMFMFEPFKTTWSPGLKQALMLHLVGWQGGLLNCIALVLSIGFFVWRVAESASQPQPTMQPAMNATRSQTPVARTHRRRMTNSLRCATVTAHEVWMKARRGLEPDIQ